MLTVINRFDERAAKVVALSPDGFRPLMTAASAVGLPATVIVVASALAILSWVKGYKRHAYAFVATFFALGGNTIIKHIVHRSRPHTMYVAGMHIKSYSFPSGHAFGSTVVYGLVAYFSFKHLAHPWNIIAPFILAMLIILIGISRVYLGAHFPSDVVAGWLLGSLSLFLIVRFVLPR